MKPAYRSLFLVSCTTLAVAALGACNKAPEPEPELRPVRTIVVTPAATKLLNTYAADVRARHETSLGFRVGGKISSRKVDVGASVKRGQVLFTLDGNDLQLGVTAARAQVAQAQAQLKAARLDLDRYASLLAKGYISQSEYDRQQAQFDASKAQVAAISAQSEQSSNQSGYSALTADADGVVTAVFAEAGQVVAAGTPVVRLARTQELEVASAVPEDQIGRIREGMDVNVTLWVDGERQTAGRVREVASSADALTRTFPVRVSLINPPSSMRLGMTASLNIPLLTPPLPHVPSSAMVTNGKQAGLWVLDGKAMVVHFQPVEFLGVEGNDVLVGKGLKPGDEVVTAGAPLLVEGQKVKRLVDSSNALPTAAARPALGNASQPE